MEYCTSCLHCKRRENGCFLYVKKKGGGQTPLSYKCNLTCGSEVGSWEMRAHVLRAGHTWNKPHWEWPQDSLLTEIPCFQGQNESPLGAQVQFCWEALAWASFSVDWLGSPPHMCWVPRNKFFCFALLCKNMLCKTNFALVFLGPAELCCPAEAAILQAKPQALVDGSISCSPCRTSQPSSSTSFWPVFFPWYPCMHTGSMCTLLYGFLSMSGSRWVGHPQARSVCRGVPPPCLRRQWWCRQQGGCTSTMLCLGWCVPLLQELISVGGISRYLSLSHCAL